MIRQERLDALKGCTEGPWFWHVCVGTKQVQLIQARSGWRYIMNFIRWGTQGAQPRFNVRMLMEKVTNLVTTDHNNTAREIDHPDARLIAMAPELLAENAELRARVVALEADNAELRMPDMWWPPGYEESGCADLDDWADDLCGVELPHRERIHGARGTGYRTYEIREYGHDENGDAEGVGWWT